MWAEKNMKNSHKCKMKYLTVLENAYIALLSLDSVRRLDFQSELIELRDTITEIALQYSGLYVECKDGEDIQEKFESIAALSSRHKYIGKSLNAD